MAQKIQSKAAEPTLDVNEISRLAKSTVIKGDISTKTDIRIDGQMEGTLKSDGRIVAGETAAIRGRIICSDLDFWGKTDGDVYVRNALSLKSSAVVNGNVFAHSLQVEMGAQINGSVKMISEAEFDKLTAAHTRGN